MGGELDQLDELFHSSAKAWKQKASDQIDQPFTRLNCFSQDKILMLIQGKRMYNNGSAVYPAPTPTCQVTAGKGLIDDYKQF